MKYALTCIIAIAAFFCCSNAYAQQQEEQKSPEEMAIIEADKLEKELLLTGTQLFYVDSILRHNFVALGDDMARADAAVTQPALRPISSKTTTWMGRPEASRASSQAHSAA